MDRESIQGLLWASGFLLVLFGNLTGKAFLPYVGIIVMGVTILCFNQSLIARFTKLYPTTNRTFIRFGTLFAGVTFILGGAYALLRFI